MSFFVSWIFRYEMEIFSADYQGSMHFGGDNGACEDTTTNRNLASERTFLIYCQNLRWDVCWAIVKKFGCWFTYQYMCPQSQSLESGSPIQHLYTISAHPFRFWCFLFVWFFDWQICAAASEKHARTAPSAQSPYLLLCRCVDLMLLDFGCVGAKTWWFFA